MRLFGGAVTGIGIQAKIGVAIKRLRVLLRPGLDFIFIDQHLLTFKPGLKLGQLFVVAVFRNPGVEPVVPVVHAADQVVPVDMAIGHQRAPVQTSSIEYRHLIVEPNDDQIDLANQCIRRLAIR